MLCTGCFLDHQIAQELTDGGVISCPILHCNHEEAYTKIIFLLFMLMFCFTERGRHIIKVDNTDTYVLCVNSRLLDANEGFHVDPFSKSIRSMLIHPKSFRPTG